MKKEQANPAEVIAAVAQLSDAFISAVREAGEMGCPGGLLYAAVTGKMSIQAFENFMDMIVASGRLTKRGQLYFYVETEAEKNERS